ncbi:MAG: FMN-dependent NADH-azoreductase [Leptolyngbya sp.]|nr:MAG: FMN-dependent NADH-azoreductase [Leptolyngbya sp.]
MAHILHLDASPRGDRSVSRTLSKEFIANWKATHPSDTVTYRDLGHHPVPLIDEPWIAAAYSAPDQYTPEQAAAIRPSNELVDEFLAADRYVFSIPMYNFSIPANFKAYLDQIVRPGRTFSVDETGYKGLVHNKKMTIITARGGTYPEGTPTHAYDLQTPYLKLIFGFIGIVEIDFVHADGLAFGDDARDLAITNAQFALKTAVAQG